MRRSIIISAICLLFISAAQGQNISGAVMDEHAELKLSGMVTNESSGKALPKAPLILTNQLTGKVKNFTADEAGKYAIDLQPNVNYKLAYDHENGAYQSPSIFISTMGVSQPVRIKRNISAHAKGSDAKVIEEPFVYRNEEAFTEAGMKADKKIKSRKKSKVVPVNASGIYVVDKEVEKVDWTKKLQRDRTDNMPTIYFYAQIPDEDMAVGLAEREQDESAPETITNSNTKATVKKVETVRREESAKKLPQEQLAKAKEKAIVPDESEDLSESTPGFEVGGLKTLDRLTEDAEISDVENPSTADSILDHEKRELALAKDLKSQLQKPVETESKVSAEKTNTFRPKRNTIYFAKGKSKISDEYSTVLDKMVEKMEANRKMKLLLVAHTDNGAEYTIEDYLSKLRAEAVQKYLNEKGISFERLEIRVAGNKFPVNGCVYGVNCSEEEHRQNRRVEIKVKANAPY